MKLLAFLMLVLVSAPAPGNAAERNAASTLPADVAKFKEQRDLCDHFRGEDPYDRERRKFLEENLSKHCTGTDQALASFHRPSHAKGVTVVPSSSPSQGLSEPEASIFNSSLLSLRPSSQRVKRAIVLARRAVVLRSVSSLCLYIVPAQRFSMSNVET